MKYIVIVKSGMVGATKQYTVGPFDSILRATKWADDHTDGGVVNELLDPMEW